jgi:hypothetical protein
MSTLEIDEDELRISQSLGWAARNAGGDYLWVRPLDDERAVYLLPMYGGNLRLAIGELGSNCFDDVWCYQAPQTDAAWRAALGWDGEGEPEGWYRHPHTGRRRPGGDAAKEHVYG